MAVFPNLSLNGCFSHFSQSLYIKVVDLCFRLRIPQQSKFSLKMQHFSAIALVFSQDVTEVFEERSGDDTIPQEFWTYLESTYIGIERGRRNNRRRAAPTCPVSFWNVYSRVVDSLSCTNSNVEAFHNVLNKHVSNSHSNILRLKLMHSKMRNA